MASTARTPLSNTDQWWIVAGVSGAVVIGTGAWVFLRPPTSSSPSDNLFTTGTTTSATSTPSANSLWLLPDGAAYIYQNGSMHWICSETVATAHGLNLSQATHVTQLPAPVGSNYAGCSASSSVPTYHYTVKSGQTLSGIATCTQTTWETLASMNHLSNPNSLSIGQVLVVPHPYQCSTAKSGQSSQGAVQLEISSASIQGV